MGFVRLAMVTIMISFVAFAFVTAFSMADANKSTDSPYSDPTLHATTVAVSDTVGGVSLLFAPMIIISGILLLAGSFYVFRKST